VWSACNDSDAYRVLCDFLLKYHAEDIPQSQMSQRRTTIDSVDGDDVLNI